MKNDFSMHFNIAACDPCGALQNIKIKIEPPTVPRRAAFIIAVFGTIPGAAFLLSSLKRIKSRFKPFLLLGIFLYSKIIKTRYKPF